MDDEFYGKAAKPKAEPKGKEPSLLADRLATLLADAQHCAKHATPIPPAFVKELEDLHASVKGNTK